LSKSLDKAPFFQIDTIEGDNILLSNYYEQKFVKNVGTRPIAENALMICMG